MYIYSYHIFIHTLIHVGDERLIYQSSSQSVSLLLRAHTHTHTHIYIYL